MKMKICKIKGNCCKLDYFYKFITENNHGKQIWSLAEANDKSHISRVIEIRIQFLILMSLNSYWVGEIAY